MKVSAHQLTLATSITILTLVCGLFYRAGAIVEKVSAIASSVATHEIRITALERTHRP